MKPEGSPEKICNDPRYTFITGIDGGTYPSTIQVVVKDKETGKLWSCHYRIWDDTSEFDCAQAWFEVKEVEVVTKEFRRV